MPKEEIEVMKDAKDLIANTLKAPGWTQTRLAKVLGISRSQMNHLISGKRTVKEDPDPDSVSSRLRRTYWGIVSPAEKKESTPLKTSASTSGGGMDDLNEYEFETAAKPTPSYHFTLMYIQLDDDGQPTDGRVIYLTLLLAFASLETVKKKEKDDKPLGINTFLVVQSKAKEILNRLGIEWRATARTNDGEIRISTVLNLSSEFINRMDEIFQAFDTEFGRFYVDLDIAQIKDWVEHFQLTTNETIELRLRPPYEFVRIAEQCYLTPPPPVEVRIGVSLGSDSDPTEAKELQNTPI